MMQRMPPAPVREDTTAIRPADEAEGLTMVQVEVSDRISHGREKVAFELIVLQWILEHGERRFNLNHQREKAAFGYLLRMSRDEAKKLLGGKPIVVQAAAGTIMKDFLHDGLNSGKGVDMGDELHFSVNAERDVPLPPVLSLKEIEDVLVFRHQRKLGGPLNLPYTMINGLNAGELERLLFLCKTYHLGFTEVHPRDALPAMEDRLAELTGSRRRTAVGGETELAPVAEA